MLLRLGSQHVLKRVVYTGALELGLVQLRGFLVDYCRETYDLERPRPSPVCFLLLRGHCSGKFRWMGRSSSQWPFRLAREARLRVCAPAFNTLCAFQHATAVYPPAMVARYLYRCIHAP